MDTQALRDILARIEQAESREMFPPQGHLHVMQQVVDGSRKAKIITSRDLLVEVLDYVRLLVQCKEAARALLDELEANVDDNAALPPRG